MYISFQLRGEAVEDTDMVNNWKQDGGCYNEFLFSFLFEE